MKSEPAVIIGAVAAAATAVVGYFVSNGTLTVQVGATVTSVIAFVAGIVTRAFVTPA